MLRGSIASVFALSLAAMPAFAADCGGQAVAEVYSHTTFGMGNMSMLFDQRAALRQIAPGRGLNGDWVVTEWSILTTLPMAAPSGAVQMFAVPEWDAECSGGMITPTIASNECKGEIPLVINNSVISWKNGPSNIGRITTASGGKTMMTLNILPDEGGFDWTMTGPVSADPMPDFTPNIFAGRKVLKGGTTDQEVKIEVRLTPAPDEMVKTLTLDTAYDGTAVGPSIGSVTQSAQGKTITLTLWGSATDRTKAASDTTLIATIERAGCSFTKTWRLIDLFVGAGVTP